MDAMLNFDVDVHAKADVKCEQGISQFGFAWRLEEI